MVTLDKYLKQIEQKCKIKHKYSVEAMEIFLSLPKRKYDRDKLVKILQPPSQAIDDLV